MSQPDDDSLIKMSPVAARELDRVRADSRIQIRACVRVEGGERVCDRSMCVRPAERKREV